MRGLSCLTGLCLGALVLAGCAEIPAHEEIQATFNQGLTAYDAGDYQTAYRIWETIEDYDLAAMRNVALMLRKGQGVDKNPRAALALMLRAADLGLVTAKADAGQMLAHGEAGPADPVAALPWLTAAADAGHPIAAFDLAQIYDQGGAVPRDTEKARHYYGIAAAAGMAGAEERRRALEPASPAPPSLGPH
jgi:uncharacterized protein